MNRWIRESSACSSLQVFHILISWVGQLSVSKPSHPDDKQEGESHCMGYLIGIMFWVIGMS